jgi:Dolichyl-phosphate-mannose-protein mannosyltransferase
MRPPDADAQAFPGRALPRGARRRTASIGDARAFARSEAAIWCGLALFCAVLALLTWGTWGDLAMDTGYDLLAGARTAGGELPYADFNYFYGPAAPALLGGVYAVVGTGIGPAIALGLVVALSIVALTYRYARELAGPLGGLFAAALTATAAFSSANNSFIMPHTLTAPLAVLFSLAALAAAFRVARGGDRRWLVASGACAGLVALCRPEFTLAVFATLAAWLVLRAIAARDRSSSIREALTLAAPALAIPAIVYGLFMTQVSPGELVRDNLFPVDYLREAGNVVLKAHAPFTPASFVELGAKLVLYGVGVAALVAAGAALAAGGRARRLALVAAGAGALGFLGVVAAKPDTVRFYLEYAYAWIPAGAWVAAGVCAWRFRRRAGAWDAKAQIELLAVLFLAVLATKSYASFLPQPNADFPPDTPYMLPFAGAFLAWLHLQVVPRGSEAGRRLGLAWLALLVAASAVLVVGDARKETVTVAGAHGQLTAHADDGPIFERALDVIERETAPGDPVLLAPQMTSLYVISGRTDPLPQLSLLPGTLADGSAEAIARMNERHVQLAITNRTPLDTYEHGPFGKTYAQGVARWLESDFRRTAVLRGTGSEPLVLDVWQRRQP